jgi:hypothetical protein
MRQDMQSKKDRGTKTETLSLRLDPKTKFILEFVSRINGQTITTVVERAIRHACDELTIYDDEFRSEVTWKRFWDPDEGFRTLRLLASPGYPTTYEEDELKSFAKVHEDFFYSEGKSYRPNRSFVQILWPRMEEYRRIWRDERDKDFWAAGKAMARDLVSARVKPPAWPPEPKTKAKTCVDG